MKLIRVSKVTKRAMPKRSSEKKIAMPKRQAKKLVAMPWLKDVDTPDEIKNRYPHLEDRVKEDVEVGEGFRSDQKPTYKGHGRKGLVSDLGNGKVSKLTPDRDEFETAKRIMDLQRAQGGSLSCVVHIYDARQKTEDIYEIIAEDVRVLTPLEQKLYNEARMIMNDMYFRYFRGLDPDNLSEEVLKDAIEQYSQLSHVIAHGYMNRGAKEMMRKVFRMNRCLAVNNLPMNDLHEENLGYRKDGTLVLLDIG